MKIIRILSAVLIPLMLISCGVKGNLKLPDQSNKKTEKKTDGSL